MALILRSCRRRAAAAACLALYALNLWGAHRLLGGIEPRPRQRQQQPQDNELDPLQMHMNRNRRPPPFFPAREMPPRQHQQRQQEQPAIGTGAPPHDMITTLDALDSTRYDYPPLDCGRLSGGRSREDEASREMVYWKARAGEAAAPAAAASEGAAVRASPPARYLTFEPDPAGFNNLRMATETVVALAVATRRTLVLPPRGRGDDRMEGAFSLGDFFDFGGMARAARAEGFRGFDVITMEEFLEREAMAARIREKTTGQVGYPPFNRTDWDGHDPEPLYRWLRSIASVPLWNSECIVPFPAHIATVGRDGMEEDEETSAWLRQVREQMDAMFKRAQSGFHGGSNIPSPVDADPSTRLRETVANRYETLTGSLRLCPYTPEMQRQPVVHLVSDADSDVRLLAHFYGVLFFQDWRDDLRIKRFIRDGVRYKDEIQCAAARIVSALRDSISDGYDGGGLYDSIHVRRGDLTDARTTADYRRLAVSASYIAASIGDVLTPGATVYIATDERNKSFFDPLRHVYNVKFMDDFKDLLVGVSPNHYGMIDQLVAARGRYFFGCFFSTFSGYIHRLRGYHSTRDKSPGYETGELPSSYYYVPRERRDAMRRYAPLRGVLWAREFPAAWRDLDKGIEEP